MIAKRLFGGPGGLVFVAVLLSIAVYVPLANIVFGPDSPASLPTTWVVLLGRWLAFAMLALALDLVWGYCGILSLGHGAFFALGGYAMGMYLMRQIGSRGVYGNPDLPDFMVFLNWSELPWYWWGMGNFGFAMLMVVLVPGLLAFGFGWLAFRSRVNGVYLSILTQAMTLALALWLFQNDAGFRGNNGLSGLQNIPGQAHVPQSVIAVRFLWGSAFALACGFLLATWITGGKFGSVIRAIRDDETRVRFLGYPVETFKLAVFTLSAMICAVAGALYYPQAGIINPAEMMPIASIYLAVWVAIGGRGRIYGAVIGAIAVSLLSSWFTGGRAPDLRLGGYTVHWVDWWQVLLGLGFVAVTLFAPRGLSSIWDAAAGLRHPARRGADLGPDAGALQEREAEA